MTTHSITVPFHGDELYLVSHNHEPFTPMKPIVAGMGMDWKTQYRKLMERFKSCVVEMTIQLPGDTQRRSVVCLALRKLPGWLYSISANKVNPSIRWKVMQYQAECDEVLWQHWSRRPALPLSTEPGRYVIRVEEGAVTEIRKLGRDAVLFDREEMLKIWPVLQACASASQNYRQ